MSDDAEIVRAALETHVRPWPDKPYKESEALDRILAREAFHLDTIARMQREIEALAALSRNTKGETP